MIKQERIGDIKFVLRNVEEKFTHFKAGDIAPLINEYGDYDVIIDGEYDHVMAVYIDHKSRTIELAG